MACLTPAPLTEANLANLARLPLRHSPMPSATPTAEAKPSLSLPLGSTSYRPPPPRSNPPSPTTVHSAIAAKERDGAMFSPSLAAILFAYGENGAGDKELLKAILVAKAEEDKRLAALDALRTEQLRSACWMAASLQSQYSPTSPVSAGSHQSSPPWKLDDRLGSPYPSSSMPPYPSYNTFPTPPTYHPSHIYTISSAQSATPTFSAPTPLAPRDNNDLATLERLQHNKRSSSTRDAPEPSPSSSSAKKARRSAPPGPATHEDVMDALRARIERNKVEEGGEVASPPVASPPAPRRRKKFTPVGAPSPSLPPSPVEHPAVAYPLPTSNVATRSPVAAKGKSPAPPTKRPSPPPRAVALVAAIRATSAPSTPYFSSRPSATTTATAGGQWGADDAPPPPSVRMLLNGGMTFVHAHTSHLRSVPA